MNYDIAEAVRILRAGGLVAFPTETVYGLGANALDPEAVARIYAAKGRPSTSPLIVHVASVEAAKALVSEWPESADRLAQQFWPGPLTLILPKRPIVPDIVTAGLPAVGIRIPAHPFALALLREVGIPLAAPSANRFTHLSPVTAEHVRNSLGDRVDMVLDGGPAKVGIESTVLSLAGPPTILRPGMVTREQIEAVIEPVSTLAQAGAGPHPAPGMTRKHYSPRTPLKLIEPGGELPEGRVAFVGFAAAEAARAVLLPRDPQAYAAAIYGVLHELDGEGYDVIAVEEPPDEPVWEGIRDRLRRASADSHS